MLASLLARYAQWLSGTSRERSPTGSSCTARSAVGCARLRDRRAFRRAAAAHSLGDMGFTAAVAALITRCRDPVRDVRAAAARSLGRIGSAVAAPELVRALAARRAAAAVGAQALLAIGARGRSVRCATCHDRGRSGAGRQLPSSWSP